MENNKFVFVYFKKKSLCNNPSDAIDFVNNCEPDRIKCNDRCKQLIEDLFQGKFSFYCFELATTGCGMSRIKIYPALADTLEKHEEIYQERAAEEKRKRIVENNKRIQDRIDELNVPLKGWYSVSLTFEGCKLGHKGLYYVETTFNGEIIAESGIDLYNKAIEHLKKDPDILPDSQFPVEYSNKFNFTFLGVKTDDGYSLEDWLKWDKKYNRG